MLQKWILFQRLHPRISWVQNTVSDFFTVLHDHKGNPVLHMCTIQHLLSSSNLCSSLGIPATIITIIAEFSLKEFRLDLDSSMIESISCHHDGVDNMFKDDLRVYSTEDWATHCEILIHLSSRNHIAKELWRNLSYVNT